MAGRPSTYNPEFCERVIEYGKQGKSITWMAAELGVHKDSLYEWQMRGYMRLWDLLLCTPSVPVEQFGRIANWRLCDPSLPH